MLLSYLRQITVTLLMLYGCVGWLSCKVFAVQPGAEQNAANIKQLENLVTEAHQAASRGEVSKAQELAGQVIDLEKKISGPTGIAVNDWYFWRRDLKNLAEVVQEHGAGDWRTRRPLLAVQGIAQYARFSPAERQRYARIFQLSREADGLAYAGEFGAATAKSHTALEQCAELLGKDHHAYASLLHDRGWILYQTRSFNKAMPVLKEAVKLAEASFGRKHPETANYLNSLAILHKNTGNIDEALLLYEEALETTRQTVGDQDLNYASMLGNIANAYADAGQYEKAIKAATHSVSLHRKLKAKDASLAVSLNNLAMVYREIDKFETARKLFLEAVELNKQGLHKHHPDYAHAIHNLAANYYDQGKPQKAGPLFREAMEIILQHHQLSASTQTEADQLASARRLRFYLNSLLAGTIHEDSAAVYELIFRARAAVTLRQMYVRIDARQNKQSQEILQKMRDISQQMSNLVARSDSTAETRKQFEKLSSERETLETELAQKVSLYNQTQKRQRTSLQDFQNQLPKGAVFVDFLEHHDKLTAFVISSSAIRRVNLGTTPEIIQAVRHFRAEILGGRKPDSASPPPGQVLRSRIWNPLAVEQADHVLICPDGILCQLPFAALPGNKDGKYLLEEIPVTVFPVPQWLPELLEGEQPASPQDRLMVVGNVAFGEPGSSPAEQPQSDNGDADGTRSGDIRWQPLPGTKVELEQITALHRNQFPNASRTVLQGPQATESEVARQLQQHSIVHFATHGLFIPPDKPPKLPVPPRRLGDVFRDPLIPTAVHPGLQTGIVLAGANRPERNTDGVLRSLEVQNLNLSNVGLVILSACETGLGGATQGEGLLGLQRAFQVAGAKSTIGSLWQIPDQATQKLMTRFYENLWNKKQSRLEALRDAQLWMLEQAGSDRRFVRALTAASQRGPRGDLRLAAPAQKIEQRLPPYYWAAFTLSGDWR